MGRPVTKLRQRQPERRNQNDAAESYGIPLKRIKFSWKSTRSLEELRRERELFWETCEAYGVLVLFL